MSKVWRVLSHICPVAIAALSLALTFIKPDYSYGQSFGLLFAKSNIKSESILPTPDKQNIIIPLDLYLNDQSIKDIERIKIEFKNAQSKLKKCGIQIKINKVFDYKSNDEFQAFESVEFNNARISAWEKDFFSSVQGLVPNVLYVNSMDWTIDDNGTIAIAYPEFYSEKITHSDENQKKFYENKMLGNTVLGNFRGPWTLTHELGHALFNLKHDDNNPENIMFPLGFARSTNPEFNKEQCDQAKLFLRTNEKFKSIIQLESL